MFNIIAAGLVSTPSIGAARENNVHNICPGRDIAWRLPGSQNQLADCPERGALPTIVMARNANGGGIRNCCQSCELLDAGKPSDGQVASTGRDLPSSSSTSPTSAGNSQQADQRWQCHVRRRDVRTRSRTWLPCWSKPFPRQWMTLQAGWWWQPWRCVGRAARIVTKRNVTVEKRHHIFAAATNMSKG